MKFQLNNNKNDCNYAHYFYFVLGTVLSTLTYSNLFIAQNNPVRQVPLLSSFYKWGNSHRETVSKLAQGSTEEKLQSNSDVF